MEFIEEVDIKEEVDMDGDPERQHGLIPDSHGWKLNSNDGCTESQSRRKLGDGVHIDPITRVHHVDLDLSDMFLIDKTIKVEPADDETNSDDPLGLCDLKDLAAKSGIETEFCQPSNIIVKKSQKVTRPGQKRYKCNVCQKDFSFENVLTRHKLLHVDVAVKPYRCEECGRCFGRNDYLTQHKKTHTGVKAHVCDFCGKGFIRYHDLTLHNMTHSGEKPYRCDVCGISFTRNSGLTRHKLIHSGEKLHRCDICGKNFTRTHHLTQHMLTHTGEKPYRCDVCGKAFGRNADLTRHKVTHTVKYNSSVMHADVVLP